jgi:hypothetical protein
VLVITIAIWLCLAACGVVFPGMPGWCGAALNGGPGLLQPGITPFPIPTPDADRLLCIAVENRSAVDFVLVETSEGNEQGSGLVAACSGMAVSQILADGWEVEVGPGDAGGMSGPAAASFEASRLQGGGPYLIKVDIRPDLSASITQSNALPPDPAQILC